MRTVNSAKTNLRARHHRNLATEGEMRLWSELRQFRKLYGIHVRRQVPIGPYVADFAIYAKRLVIEVDGESHFTSSGIAKDVQRDEWLRSQGYRVFRMTTTDVLENMDGCIEGLLRELGV